MKFKKVRLKSYITQGAFPPYYLRINKQNIPGTKIEYYYKEMVLIYGLPDPRRGVHGHAMINAIFSHFPEFNSIIIPRNSLGHYIITRSEWKSFDFLMCDFNTTYQDAKLY